MCCTLRETALRRKVIAPEAGRARLIAPSQRSSGCGYRTGLPGIWPEYCDLREPRRSGCWFSGSFRRSTGFAVGIAIRVSIRGSELPGSYPQRSQQGGLQLFRRTTWPLIILNPSTLTFFLDRLLSNLFKMIKIGIIRTRSVTIAFLSFALEPPPQHDQHLARRPISAFLRLGWQRPGHRT
jgi:hypothetical protein